MRAIWKGSLNFGLVTIDIDIVTAIKEHAVSFKLLHDKCETPIHNLRWCDHCDQEVSWDHVVKGLPISKNKYFIITKEALGALKPLGSDVITIETFVDEAVLDPIWFDQHYYALAHKEKDRAYPLFVEALEKSGKVAIGRIIMKEKEHVCVLQAYKGRLLLTTLHYPYEIRPLPKTTKETSFSKEELELAQNLVEKFSHKKVSPTLFKDTFVEKLKKLLASKTKRAEIKAIPTKKEKKAETSLVETLKESLKSSPKKQTRAK